MIPDNTIPAMQAAFDAYPAAYGLELSHYPDFSIAYVDTVEPDGHIMTTGFYIDGPASLAAACRYLALATHGL